MAKNEMEMYIDAVELKDLAKKIYDKKPELPIQTAAIKYLFSKSTPPKIGSGQKVAQLVLVKGHYRYLTGIDYIVEIWQEAWTPLTPYQQEAEMLNVLLYAEIKEDEDGGRTWSKRKPPIDGFFPEAITEYGVDWNPALKAMETAVKSHTG